MPSVADQERIGPYSVLSKVGEGGMGIVYRVEQHRPVRRTLALKVIKRGLDTKSVIGRFEAERQALALMDHPSIAKVLDAGETEGGRPYFVMEFVSGLPVTEYCDENRLMVNERLELFVEICDAVQSAHQKGVIHRDLKPSNIIVEKHGGEPQPKIIDFGIAKSTEAQLTDKTVYTEFGEIIGTPEYMSPEQLEMTEDVDTRSDVYSLGVLLYELLVGERPFRFSAASLTEIQRTIYEEEPQRPSTLFARSPETDTAAKQRRTEARTLGRQLRGDLDWITMTALAKDRSRRYGSASELAADIERHLNHEPIVARPPSLTYRLTKLAQRNRAIVFASGLVVLAALVGVGVGEGGLAVAAIFGLVVLLGWLSASTTLLRQARRAQADEARQREEADEQRQVAEEEEVRSNEQREIAEQMERLARERAKEAEEARAETQEALALSEERLAEVLRLSDVKRIAEINEQADALWPALPQKLREMEEWLTTAAVLAERLPLHKETLTELRRNALPYGENEAKHDAQTHPHLAPYQQKVGRREELAAEIAATNDELARSMNSAPPAEETGPEKGPHVLTPDELRTKLAALQRQDERLASEIASLAPTLGERTTWRFAESEDQWRHDVLQELVSELATLTDPDPNRGAIASVRKRVAFATDIEHRSITSCEARAAWEQAIADIQEVPIYAGLELKPQIGLFPLRRDPESGLWEFWHVASGARPELCTADSVNPWRIGENTGIVMVLLPGGAFEMGAQAQDPSAPNYDPQSSELEGPPQRVTLAPFFVGRFPLTQGQWLAATGENPSIHNPDSNWAGKQHDLRHPVENVTWNDCREVLRQLDLELPTEAQWEFGCRGGTTTPWWTGVEVESLSGATNLWDQFAVRNGPRLDQPGEEWLDTGYVCHAPVGTFRANPFGMHDLHGTVWEWCRDRFGVYDQHEHEGDAAERVVPGTKSRVVRGGSFLNRAFGSRSTSRSKQAPENRNGARGVRAARRCG